MVYPGCLGDGMNHHESQVAHAGARRFAGTLLPGPRHSFELRHGWRHSEMGCLHRSWRAEEIVGRWTMD